MAKELIRTKAKLKEAVNELVAHSRLSHDTETTGPSNIGGLYPFHGSRSFSHIFATKDDEFYFDFNVGGINPKYKKDLQPIFSDHKRIIFYVNAIFDAAISHFDGIEFKQRVIDCPSIARVEFNNHDGGRYVSAKEDGAFLSMEYLADYYGVQRKIDIVKKYIEENNLYSADRCKFTDKKIPLFNMVPLELMFEYGCGDARTTFDLGNKILTDINWKDSKYNLPTKMIHVAQNEAALTPCLIQMKIDGCKLDIEYTEKAIKHETKTSEVLHAEIEKLTDGINLNSGAQVGAYLESRGIDVPRNKITDNAIKQRKNWEDKKLEFVKKLSIGDLKERKIQSLNNKINQADEKILSYSTGNYKTDAETLELLYDKHPTLDFLVNITKAKQADKKLSTYYGNFMKLRDATNVIHGELNQGKAITGRFSGSNPNFQNLHKEVWKMFDEAGLVVKVNEFLIRKSIISKDPKNFDLFFFDYKGQEMYIMIDLAEDQTVIKDILDNGTDIYIAMANMVFKYTNIQITRQQAKALALGVAYGQGKALIAKNLKCSLKEAKKLKDAFLNALKGVAKLNRRMMKLAESKGRISNPYGRVSYIKRDLAYKALNSLIQGSAADCTKFAMVKLHELLKPYKTHMILTVHDEVIFEMHKEERYLVPQIQKIMSDAYPHKHLPLKVDVEWSSTSWGEKVDYEGEVA